MPAIVAKRWPRGVDAQAPADRKCRRIDRRAEAAHHHDEAPQPPPPPSPVSSWWASKAPKVPKRLMGSMGPATGPVGPPAACPTPEVKRRRCATPPALQWRTPSSSSLKTRCRTSDFKPAGSHGACAPREQISTSASPSPSPSPATNLRGYPTKRGRAAPAIADLRTVVVNLDRRPDRWHGCLNRIGRACANLRCERLSATDGAATRIPEPEVSLQWNTSKNCVFQRRRSRRKGWNDLDTYREQDLKLSPGERGCASSHIVAWRQCLAASIAAGGAEIPLLVLEDDAAPTSTFASVLERCVASCPADADVMYLGYSQAGDWRADVNEDLVEAEYVWTTVAYIIWPKGARKILKHMPVNQPVDNFMAQLCADRRIKSYCVRPKIILQAEPWNVNSDVGHSDEISAQQDSNITHSDGFYWGPIAPTVSSTGISSSFWDALSSESESEDDLPRPL